MKKAAYLFPLFIALCVFAVFSIISPDNVISKSTGEIKLNQERSSAQQDVSSEKLSSTAQRRRLNEALNAQNTNVAANPKVIFDQEKFQANQPIFKSLSQALQQNLDLPANRQQAIEIAKQAMPVMKQLVLEDPEIAYELALENRTWAALPDEIRPLVARRFSEHGILTTKHNCDDGARHVSILTESVDTSLASTAEGVAKMDANYLTTLTGVALEKFAGIIAMAEDENLATSLFNSQVAYGDQPAGANSYSYTPYANHVLPRIGNLRVLSLIVRHGNETTHPTTVTNVTNIMNSVKTLFTNYSKNRVNLIFDVVQVTIAAANTDSDYTILEQTAAAAAALGYNPDQYNSIIRRTSNRGNYAWFHTKDVFWRNDNPTTVLHEMGHNLGLQHANYWRPNAGQPIWAKSNSGVNQIYGEDFDAMANSPRGDFNAWEKSYLTWLSGNEVATNVSAGTYRIYPYDDYTATLNSTGVNGAHYAVSVFKDTSTVNEGDANRQYFISMRNQNEHGANFNPWTTNGIQLHWSPWTRNGTDGFDANGAFGTSFIDTKPASNTNGALGQYRTGVNSNEQFDGAVLVGRTYVDNDPGNRDGTIYITPMRKVNPDGILRNGDEYIDVKIAIGNQTGNQSPTATWNLSSILVAPGATFTASVNATDPNGDSMSYFWDFGIGSDGLSRRLMPLDGNPNQSYVWNTEGTYTVSCIVTDGRGGTQTLTQSIIVQQAGNLAGKVTSLTGVGQPNGSINLAWDAITNPNFSHYRVYRSTTAGAYGIPLADNVTTPAFTDNTWVSNTRYYYVVRTVDTQNGESLSSNEVSYIAGINQYAPLVNAGADQFVRLNSTVSWSPANTTTQLWLDAADSNTITLNGSNVAQWNDKSTNLRHATQATAAAQPTLTSLGLNSKNTVTFDGNSDFLNLGTGLDFMAGSAHSAFIVLSNVTNYTNIYGAANGGTASSSVHVGFNGSTKYRSNAWGTSLDYGPNITANFTNTGSVVNYVWPVGTPRQIFANGKTEGSSSFNSTAPIALSGGGRISNVVGQGFLGARIGEIVFLTGAVSQTDRERMEGYLAHKWALTANLATTHPHKTQAPTLPAAIPNLSANVTDADGQTLTLLWTKVSGPGDVTFANPTSTQPNATFFAIGTYTLRLTANDGFTSVSDDIVIDVTSANYMPPIVNAGVDRVVSLNNTIPWTPAYTTSQLWLDAADASSLTLSGSALTQWNDKSTNQRHATQSTATAQPTITTAGLNGKNTVTFDGNSDFLNLGTGLDFMAGSAHSAFIVLSNVTNYTNIYGAANGGTASSSVHVGFNNNTKYRSNAWGTSLDYGPNITANFTNTGSVVNYVWPVGTPRQIFANGKIEGSSSFNSTAPNALSGGGRICNVVGQGFLGARIGEIVFLTGAVSQADRERMEGYLAHKWALTANLATTHPHKTEAPSLSNALATLAASVTPGNGQIPTLLWTKVSGPGEVTFSSPSAIQPDITFWAPGTYVLRLSANDGITTISDEVVINVNTNAITFPVTYVGNGNTSGSVPVDTNSPYANAASVTVLGNLGNLARTGYSFTGWNTAANGSGINYMPGSSFIINADTSLFAQWAMTPYTAWANNTFTNSFTNTGFINDPDADGIKNLMEFAFGLDPTIPTFRSLNYVVGGDVIATGMPKIVNVMQSGQSDAFKAVFPRRKDHAAAGLVYEVHFSADLDRWTVGSVVPVLETNASSSGAMEVVSVPFPATVPLQAGGSGVARFSRVEVRME